MRKMKREKIIREVLQAKLEKYERRMQRISEESYKLRTLIDQIDEAKREAEAAKAPKPIETKEAENAVPETSPQAGS